MFDLESCSNIKSVKKIENTQYLIRYISKEDREYVYLFYNGPKTPRKIIKFLRDAGYNPELMLTQKMDIDEFLDGKEI